MKAIITAFVLLGAATAIFAMYHAVNPPSRPPVVAPLHAQRAVAKHAKKHAPTTVPEPPPCDTYWRFNRTGSAECARVSQ